MTAFARGGVLSRFFSGICEYVFESRLDDEIRVGQCGEVCRCGQPALGLVAGARRHPAFADVAIKKPRHPLLGCGGAVGVSLDQDGRQLRRSQEDIGDAGAHRSRAGDADPLDAHFASSKGMNALIPVASRPMISFWICEVPS